MNGRRVRRAIERNGEVGRGERDEDRAVRFMDKEEDKENRKRDSNRCFLCQINKHRIVFFIT